MFAIKRFGASKSVALGVAVIGFSLVLAGCGAGEKTAAKSAATVACDFDKPAAPVTVNVLAYNSSAIDPYTNTMVSSCSRDGVTVKHDPIDFAGQDQKTATTLSGEKGSYDILEVYGAEMPYYASQKSFQPLDDVFAKYKDKYQLGDIDPLFLKALTFDGNLYGLPTQANISTFVYRKDIFDKLGLTAPKTYADMMAAAQKIQSSGTMQYPIALPASDGSTLYEQTMTSQGVSTVYVDTATMQPTFNTPEAKKGLTALHALSPYMDPQVTSFDQPKVQQQLYNGKAAMAIMFSGRMADLLKAENSTYSANFAFAAPPAIDAGGKSGSSVSVDGWAVPANTTVSPDLLFQLMAASVSPDASANSVPAAYPARRNIASDANTPYAAAVKDALANGATPPAPYPWFGPIENDTFATLVSAIKGDLTVDDALAQCQAQAVATLAKT